MKLREPTKPVIYNQLIQPPIPFQISVRSAGSRGSTHKLDLRVNPANANSETYQTEIHLFNKGTPEEWFEFYRDYKKVEAGQLLNTGPMRFAMMRNLLYGEAQRVFEQESRKASGETIESFTGVINNLASYFLPVHALPTQKRYMRRYLLKPRGCKIREYVSRLHELNSLLAKFPPCDENQRFSDQELSEILEHSLPTSWQRQMTVQGISSTQHSVLEIVEFCERLETLEELAPSHPTMRVTHMRNRAIRPKSDRNGRLIDSKWSAKPSAERQFKRNMRQSTKTPKWCAYHNTSGHDISECKVMLDQAKKMRANWAAQTKPKGIKRANIYKDMFSGMTQKEANWMMRRHIKECTADNHYIAKQIANEKQKAQKEKAKKQPNVSMSEDSSHSSECNHMELFQELSVSDEAGNLV